MDPFSCMDTTLSRVFRARDANAVRYAPQGGVYTPLEAVFTERPATGQANDLMSPQPGPTLQVLRSILPDRPRDGDGVSVGTRFFEVRDVATDPVGNWWVLTLAETSP